MSLTKPTKKGNYLWSCCEEDTIEPQCSHNGRFYTGGRIVRLDGLGQAFVVRLIIRLWCEDGRRTHYPSR